MRTAWAEIRVAPMHRRLVTFRQGLQRRHTRQHGIGAEGLRQAREKRAQYRGGIEFTQIRKQRPPGFVTLAGRQAEMGRRGKALVEDNQDSLPALLSLLEPLLAAPSSDA